MHSEVRAARVPGEASKIDNAAQQAGYDKLRALLETLESQVAVLLQETFENGYQRGYADGYKDG